MKEVSIIGLDLAKNVFQAHGASATGMVALRKKLRRAQLLALFYFADPMPRRDGGLCECA